MPTLFAASPFLCSAPSSSGYLNLFLRHAYLPTRLHRTFSARLLHGCVQSGWVRCGCGSFVAGLPQPISQVHGTLMQLGNIPHGNMLLKMVTELPRKWRGTVMQGARYCHSNYATNAVDAQTTYSFDDLISEGISQKAYKSKAIMPSDEICLLDYSAADEIQKDNEGPVHAQSIGKRISAEDKKKFLVNTLIDMKDSKEAIYGTLDAWVAWEQNFPLALLKRALLVLEKEEQWHRIVQVIKWMLSKGQGITMGTYEQLIRALEKDCRPEEAHNIWVKKISYDLHSVPWRFCDLMLSIYYRNNMLERLVKLFKDIESFGRKPPSKSIVRKVVDAYELLGLLEEKNVVLQKYDDLFNSSSRESSKKSRKFSKRGIAAGRQKPKSQEAIDRSTADQAPMNLGAQG